MALKTTWQVDDSFTASDQNAVSIQVNQNTDDIAELGAGAINDAVQDALDEKQDTSQKGQANGYAPLDATNQIPAVHLPAYVDDVLEYATLAAFPATGTSGKIYVATGTGKTYRWGGSSYVEMVSSPGTTDSLTEGTTNLYYTQARADARVASGVAAERTATATYTGKTIDGATNTLTGIGLPSLSATGTKDSTTVLHGDNVFRVPATAPSTTGILDAVDGSAITTSTALQTALDAAAIEGKVVALKPGQTITFGTGVSGITVPAYSGIVCETNAEWKTGAPSTLRPKLVAQSGMTGPIVTVAGGARGVRLRGFDIDGNNVAGVTMGLYFSTAGTDVENSHSISNVAVRRVSGGVGITGRTRTSVFEDVSVFECQTGVILGTNGCWFDSHWNGGYVALNKNAGVVMAADGTGNVSQYVQFTNLRVERNGMVAGDPKNLTASANWNNTTPGWDITGAAKCTWLSCTTDANTGPGVKIIPPGAGLGYRTTTLTFTSCIFGRDGQYNGSTTGNMAGVSVLGFSAAGPDRATAIRFENCFVAPGGSADDGSSTYAAPYYGVQAEYLDFFVWHGNAHGDTTAFQGLTDLWQPEIIDQYAQTYIGGIANRANHSGATPAANVSGLATVATTGSYTDLSNKPTIPTGASGASAVPAIPNAADVETLASIGTVTVASGASSTSIASGVEAANMVSQPHLFGLVGTSLINMATISTFFRGPGWKDNYAGGSFGSVVTGNWAVDIWVGGSRYVEFIVGRTDYSAVAQYSYRVWVDGKKKTNLPVATGFGANGTPNAIKIDLGASVVAPHRVKLEMSGLALMNAFVEPAGQIWAAAPTGPRLFVLGCSITQGPTAVAANTGFENGTWLHRFANIVGLQDVWNGAEAGSGPNTVVGGYQNYKTRVTTQLVPAAPDIVIVDTYFNDFATRTKANLVADYTQILNDIAAARPATKVICMGGMDPTGTTNTAAMQSIDSDVDGLEKVCKDKGAAFISPVTGRITAFNGTLLATTKQWITTANKATYISTLDNLHPTDAGQEMIAYQMRNAWSLIWDNA